jgi:hypothetical protein
MLVGRVFLLAMAIAVLWITAPAMEEGHASGPQANQSPTQRRASAERSCERARSRGVPAGAQFAVVLKRPAQWPYLLLAFAACAAGVYIAVLVRRRRRTMHSQRVDQGLLERFSGLVALATGVLTLITQFFPGVGVNDRPRPSAAMTVRQVDAHITRDRFERAAGVRRRLPVASRDELGDVIWLELKVAGYRGRPLVLTLEKAEPGYDAAAIPATQRQVRLINPDDADAVRIWLPLWVALQRERFQVRFYLTEGNKGLLQVARTKVLRGVRDRNPCRSGAASVESPDG